MSQTVAITGATGKVGGAIAGNLLNSGIKVKAFGRNPEKLSSLRKNGAETFTADFENSTALSELFKGSDAVFLMIPPCYHLQNFKETMKRISSNLTEAVRRNNIPYVVALSSVGADLPEGNGQISALYEFESMLNRLTDSSVLILRPAFFMENHLISIPLIKNAGINGSIMDNDSQISMVAVKDIAGFASEHLRNLSFSGLKINYLLGPRDYTFKEATSILGKAIGKNDLAYVKFPEEEFIKGIQSSGFSENAALALREGFLALNEGKLTKHVKRDKTNTTSTTLEEFAQNTFAHIYNNS